MRDADGPRTQRLAELRKISKSIAAKPVLYDILVLIGVFVFTAVLIIGLFPRDEAGAGASRNFFLYSMMAVPFIVAVYIIIISFRRRLARGDSRTVFSIRIKIALAFVFVAILPSLPIILVSNNIINHMISDLITEKTAGALEESIRMSRESISQRHEEIRAELVSLDGAIRNGILTLGSPGGREAVSRIYGRRGYGVLFYHLPPGESSSRVPVGLENAGAEYAADIASFLGAVRPAEDYGVFSVSVNQSSLLLGAMRRGPVLVTLYYRIPGKVFDRISLFEESLGRYKEREYLKSYFRTGAGIFLLILAIFIVVLSVLASLLLSKNITRPVLELEEAARSVAAGNFNIALKRESPDELALLFSSFNKMIKQLEESRKAMYHMQKLEAWREVARKLVHEIRNPLTPIRLSAERIQKRYREGNPGISEIIINGTNTIIEEVDVLMAILGEFSRFARLPEMNPLHEDLNASIENCVNFFHGHEKVTFHLDLDRSMPPVYFDKMLLRQAFTNIIQNSIDAIGEKGNIYIQSRLVKGDGAGMASISLRDDGAGIKPEDMEKIFEPTYSTKAHGTGLGLTIVEKIILEHRGRISCRSRVGEGTEFTIELPLSARDGGADGKSARG
jgi:two-component system, NtrC family, nitrogen regulation sensor histidine kinase NtrY